jgi:hypothetical protein
VYCSARCRLDDWNIRHSKLKESTTKLAGRGSGVCLRCKTVFASPGKAGKQRFCSSECWWGQYREDTASRDWEWRLQKAYGISGEDYSNLLTSQGGGCAVCGSLPKGNRLSVDHDHRTGEVRGLLCAPCNRALGYFERHEENMIAYIERRNILRSSYPNKFEARRSYERYTGLVTKS